MVNLFALIFILALLATLAYITGKRGRAMKAVARSLGFTYVGRPTLEQRRQAIENSWLCRPHDKHPVSHFMTGNRGEFRVDVFDFISRHGNRSYTQTVISVHLPHQRLPAFNVRQKLYSTSSDHWLSDEKTIVVTNPADFPLSHVLTASDIPAVRALITQAFLGFFVNEPRLHAEGNHGRLLLYWHEVSLEPKRIEPAIDHALFLARELEKGRHDEPSVDPAKHDNW